MDYREFCAGCPFVVHGIHERELSLRRDLIISKLTAMFSRMQTFRFDYVNEFDYEYDFLASEFLILTTRSSA